MKKIVLSALLLTMLAPCAFAKVRHHHRFHRTMHHRMHHHHRPA